ncbi:MAG: leucine-rich repeat domain-containing protein [Isosphaerales bacterium]
MSEKPSSRSLRHRLRVSVRALMILVLLVGAGLGWIVRSARIQRESVAAIEKAGGFVFYDCELNPDRTDMIRRRRYLEWLAGRVGIDYFSNVVEMSLPGDLSDAELALVGQFPRLEELYSDGSQSSVTDAGLAHMVGLTRLKKLDLSGTGITDSGLVHLRGMAGLQELYLSGTGITDSGLVHLRRMARLHDLDLSGDRITDAGLVHLKGLTSLWTLSLRKTEVSEAGVMHLKNLTNLQLLDLTGTKVDDFAAQEFRRALPRAKVFFTGIQAR